MKKASLKNKTVQRTWVDDILTNALEMRALAGVLSSVLAMPAT
jgi:hypothetical protein